MSYLGRSAKLSRKAQEKTSFLATSGQTVATGLSYVATFVEVYVNGILLTDTSDYTATNGNSITFTVALGLNDEVTVVALKTFALADHYNKSSTYTKTEADAGFEPIIPSSTTAPSSPAVGDMWFDSTTHIKSMKVWSGTEWDQLSNKLTATGGTITISGAYTIHTFTSSGTFTPSTIGVVDYLVVAGGGGGGGAASGNANAGGGAGAGGFRTATGFSVAPTGLTVTIGAGGAGGAQADGSSGNGSKGGNSVFSSITATGGGYGGGVSSVGGNGGSGGGGGWYSAAARSASGTGNEGGFSPVEGYAGSNTTPAYYWTAGGGGGAGAIGGSPAYYLNHNGGVGISNSFSGSAVTYAAGGSGSGIAGGSANTGNGASGGTATGGGVGGSGIVIIRYLT